MKTYYIVWNEGKSEGFVTDDVEDAKQVKSKRFRNPYTTAGAAFKECYEDDKLSLQEIEI